MSRFLFGLGTICFFLVSYRPAVGMEVKTESGYFPFFDGDTETNYTITLPSAGIDVNGDLFLVAPPQADAIHGPLVQSGETVAANGWLAEDYGFAVGSVDYGNHDHRGWRIEDQVNLYAAFAEWARTNYNLQGKTFVKGSEAGAWVALAALILKKDTFAGGLSSGGVTDARLELGYLQYSLFNAISMGDWMLAAHRLRALNAACSTMGGPFIDRDDQGQNSQLIKVSAAARPEDIFRPLVIRQGDSDLYVHPSSFWKLVDALKAAQNDKTIIGELMIGRGAQAPAEEDTAGDRKWTRLVADWVHQRPFDPEAGTLIAQPDPATRWTPQVRDIRDVKVNATPAKPGMLSVKRVFGAGVMPAAFGSAMLAGKFGECEKTCVMFGDATGFLHVFELVSNGEQRSVRRVWRSRRGFGAPVTGLSYADVDGDDKKEIVAGFMDGALRVISADNPEEVKNERLDDLGSPMLDVFAVDAKQGADAGIIARTGDGYVFLFDGGTLAPKARSEWIGSTLWTGLDVGDMDGDGQLDVVSGDGAGYVKVLRASTMELVRTSGYLGFFPQLVKLATISQGGEAFVNGSAQGWGGVATTVVLNKELSEIRRFDSTGSFFSMQRKQMDEDPFDELFLGGEGLVAYGDTSPQAEAPQTAWTGRGELGPITAVAVADFDGDRALEVAALSASGSLYFLSRDGWTVEAAYHGPGGTFATAVADLDADGRDEIIAGTRSAGVRIFSGETFEEKGGFEVDGAVHAVEAIDVGADGKAEVFVGTGERGYRSGGGHIFAFQRAEDGTWTSIWRTEQDNGPIWGLKAADVDRDGKVELVAGNEFTTEEGAGDRRATLYVYDAAGGALRASLQVIGHDLFAIEAADIDWDEKIEIITGDRRGYFSAFNFDGAAITQKLMTAGALGGRIGDLDTPDLDGNGRPEVLLGEESGKVFHIKYKDGKMIKIAESPDLGTHAWGVLAADLDGNGAQEVVAGNAAGSLFVFDPSLSVLLDRLDGLGGFIGAYGSLNTAEIDGDPGREIVAGSAGYIYVIDVASPAPVADGGTDAGPDASIGDGGGAQDSGRMKLRGGGGCSSGGLVFALNAGACIAFFSILLIVARRRRGSI